MKLVDRVQSHIESIYGIRVGEMAGDYLIDSLELSHLLQANQSTVFPKELFLVNPKPEDDTVEVALYLCEDLRSNLLLNDPRQGLHAENLSDFCMLIEGVSHFIYYLYKAAADRPVTQLELELQAEVDKFVLLSLFTQSAGEVGVKLLQSLFEHYQLRSDLKEDEKQRYEEASRLAEKYCYSLLENFSTWEKNDLLQEVRCFYELDQSQKIQKILA